MAGQRLYTIQCRRLFSARLGTDSTINTAVCGNEGMDWSALLGSAIIILVIFLLLLGIGEILIYAVKINKKISFFCVLFC